MPSLTELISGLGKALEIGGDLYSADRAAAATKKQAQAYRLQGDNALLVSEFNAKQYERRADQIRERGGDLARQGVIEENNIRIGTANLISSQRAAYAGGNIVVNRGTPASMQISAARQGEVDALRIRDNYVSALKANQVEETVAREQGRITLLEGGLARDAAYNTASALEDEADNIRDSSYADALGSLATTAVAGEWLDAGADLIGGLFEKSPALSAAWGQIKELGKSAVAGAAGGYIGQEIGEELTGRQANNNWGAGVGSVVGHIFGGPIGAAVGGAFGGLLDAAFGGRSYSHNAGFLLHDVPGAPADRKFEIEPFASGLKPVGFMRRESKEAALAAIEPFRQIDKSVVDLAAKYGKTVTAQYVRGTDEAGEGDGVFIGSAGEDNRPGKPVSAHLYQYTSQLIQSLQGQIPDTAYQKIQAAPTVEEKVAELRRFFEQGNV